MLDAQRPPCPAPPPHRLQVTLIDQSDRFVFKPLLYELLSGAASEEEVAPPFAQLLAPYPVTFVQGRVASVQPEHATQVREAAGRCRRLALGVPACLAVERVECYARLSDECASLPTQPPTAATQAVLCTLACAGWRLHWRWHSGAG